MTSLMPHLIGSYKLFIHDSVNEIFLLPTTYLKLNYPQIFPNSNIKQSTLQTNEKYDFNPFHFLFLTLKKSHLTSGKPLSWQPIPNKIGQIAL